jgi:hypothetical protein
MLSACCCRSGRRVRTWLGGTANSAFAATLSRFILQAMHDLDAKWAANDQQPQWTRMVYNSFKRS